MKGDWLTKAVDREERLDFIRRFQEHHASAGSPADSALFMRRDNGERRPFLLLPPGHRAIAEALSPGGWEPCVRPTTTGWMVVVGDANASVRFGILI